MKIISIIIFATGLLIFLISTAVKFTFNKFNIEEDSEDFLIILYTIIRLFRLSSIFLITLGSVLFTISYML